MLVGQNTLLQTANNLEDLMHQAVDVLNRYYNHSTELQSGGLEGGAGQTNVVTAEEIQHAQMKIQTRWGHVIDLVRSNTHNYGQQDEHNAASIAAVASDLRWT
ncbi:hypothetical protein [Mycobacterium branderi]|uniref:Uncharacterized protein n=1 Tax=Mycobacterium branderi TaxID=43348 RepID=A0A7I7WDK8_9MYCO|nr:hypothetical protein [Mycobacterium branderi]MCV7235251.1 hypothetical protein [Mycobacterium branderi]ORA29852.1 hypothetical protein BST20_27745 [Mycobacterium branderi]BBZ15022.1 hypothetical protein MBRA_52170 [Mycobacterium branderi]